MVHATYLILAVISLLVIIIASVLFYFWYIHWRPKPPSVGCTGDTQCSTTEKCVSGVCQEITCKDSSDCPANQICFGQYCLPQQCQSSNECPNGYACNGSICVPASGTCNNSNDCFGGMLKCLSGKCGQCQTANDCSLGQYCSNSICLYPTQNSDCDNNSQYFESKNTPIYVPPGYCCQNTNGLGNTCKSGQNCANNLFCVNDVCRCIKGEVYEGCVVGNDCASNNCLNGICGFAGTECLYNYSSNADAQTQYMCPIEKPWCTNGTCANGSLGAICGSVSQLSDLCISQDVLGATAENGGPTGVGTMGYFCVNDICSIDPGLPNQHCDDFRACLWISYNGTNSNLTCTNNICVTGVT